MNRKEVTEICMMISNWKKNLSLHELTSWQMMLFWSISYTNLNVIFVEYPRAAPFTIIESVLCMAL